MIGDEYSDATFWGPVTSSTDMRRDTAGSSFEVFATREAPRLLRVARRLTNDHYEAEDLVQETLLRTGLAWDRIEHRNDPGGAFAYAVAVLANRSRSWRRLAWRRHERRPTDNDGRLDSCFADPLDTSERSDELGRLLKQLPAKQRTAVVLRFYLDLSEEQTAKALGCSIGNVKSQTSRGLKKLRALTNASSTNAERSQP